MRYAKLLSLKVLSLGLVALTLLGCNKSPQSSQVINPVEAANTPQEENSAPQKVATNNTKNTLTASTVSQSQNSPSVTAKNNKQTKTGNQIGPAFDCDNDGQADDARMDYDGDGIPDDCVVNDAKKTEATTQTQNSSFQYGTLEELNAKLKKRNGRVIGSASCDGDGLENDVRVDFNGDGMPDECVTANLRMDVRIDETSYQTVVNSLEAFTKGCEESKKTQGNLTYTICKVDGQPVSASEYLTEFGDGLAFWLVDRQVIAARRLHSGELYVFDKSGKLSSMFADNLKTYKTEKVTNIRDEDRKEAEKFLYNGHKDIFKVFNL